ncbi:hypothetical protein NM688_g6545 [Phlebia brevispora]|uniref:Uncharacterized protein n=1 Tax=Phlebia brevispora TaxID=194682 RepID=A0ACC1SF77_9APHY|nr:hypothetical protein NM688_g6545 [Phlebia brevispora]
MAEMLFQDLRSTLLAYYPLKADVAEAICTTPALALALHAGYVLPFVQGTIGNAAKSSDQGGALALPKGIQSIRRLADVRPRRCMYRFQRTPERPQWHIGDIMFFRQHIHNIIALALVDRHVTSEGDRIERRLIPLLVPFLALGAMQRAEVVDHGVSKVEHPAAPGKRVTDADIDIYNDDYPATLEGPVNVSGLDVSVGLKAKLSYLVTVQNERQTRATPLRTTSQMMAMMGCPLAPKNADEMLRAHPKGLRLVERMTISFGVSSGVAPSILDKEDRLKLVTWLQGAADSNRSGACCGCYSELVLKLPSSYISSIQLCRYAYAADLTEHAESDTAARPERSIVCEVNISAVNSITTRVSLHYKESSYPPSMSTTITKDGVIDYPITDGMSLVNVWDYVDSPNGAKIVAKSGFLDISRGPSPAENQWTMFTIAHNVSVARGAVIQFEVKYDLISPPTEVKLTLAGGIILRYGGATLDWVWWNQDGIHEIAPSSIRVGDGAYHQITLCVDPSAIVIFENGNYIGKWDTSVAAEVTPRFDWQIFDRNTSLGAQLRNILVIPSTFAPSVGTPWDIAFSNTSIPPANLWQVDKQKDDPIPISFSADGFMRASTQNLSIANSWVFPKVAVPMAPFGLVMFRMRVNVSGGSETKITLMGNNILRIKDDGQFIQWQKYDGDFVKLSDSAIRVGGDWTTVTLVYSQTSISLLENGVYRYTQTYTDSGKPWEAIFFVQHRDNGTAISVDLSNVRCVPFAKTAEMLIRDLQPTLLAYYPLKADLTEAICTIPALDLAPYAGYVPTFVQGMFGKAAQFAGQGGALALPLYPYGRAFPSYTLALWVKVDTAPAHKAGIVGPLCVLADGRIEFTFVYSDIMSYKQTAFTSVKRIPQGQWVSIIATYTYEESRFAMFIDGALDSIVYTAQGDASRAAVLPMYGYIGACTDSNGNLSVLNGQVGDIMFFRQHIHDVIALALANKPVTAHANHKVEERALVFPFLLPIFLILAYEVVSTAIITLTLEQTFPSTPDVKRVVAAICAAVGVPAGPGKQVTRADIHIDDNFPIVLDIGGEGPTSHLGLVTGFEGAINVNDRTTVSTTSGSPIEIPDLVLVKSWATNPGYPFADNFADRIVMMGSPLTPKGASEMVRVIKPTGTIDVWIDGMYLPILEDMARRLKSSLRTATRELDKFQHNGHEWFIRRQIVANKNGNDDL